VVCRGWGVWEVDLVGGCQRLGRWVVWAVLEVWLWESGGRLVHACCLVDEVIVICFYSSLNSII
jgi:hypothetical protein